MILSSSYKFWARGRIASYIRKPQAYLDIILNHSYCSRCDSLTDPLHGFWSPPLCSRCDHSLTDFLHTSWPPLFVQGATTHSQTLSTPPGLPSLFKVRPLTHRPSPYRLASPLCSRCDHSLTDPLHTSWPPLFVQGATTHSQTLSTPPGLPSLFKVRPLTHRPSPHRLASPHCSKCDHSLTDPLHTLCPPPLCSRSRHIHKTPLNNSWKLIFVYYIT